MNLLDWLAVRDAPNWAVARPLGGLASLALALLFLLALLTALMLLGRTVAGGEGSLGTGALIVALLSAPFLIWNTVIRHRALEFQKEGHLTDRLAKAVEQLGAEKVVKKIVTDSDGRPTTQETSEPNLEVRIGGLLSLERIAQDSTAYDKGRDHVRVMEIICAYIRNNAPASSAKDFPLRDLDPLPNDASPDQRAQHLDYVKLRRGDGGNLRDWSASLPGPREDITLALLILERRSDQQRRIEAAHGHQGVSEAGWVFAEPCPELPEQPLDQQHPPRAIGDFKQHLRRWKLKLFIYRGFRPDLRRTCLQCADLSTFRLSGIRLDGARLEGANLVSARLEGADLGAARLEGADLVSARLEGANLVSARLEEADLGKAWLEGADLGQARLEGTNFRGARLEGADFGEARLEGKDLGRARLEGANLMGARLKGAHLEDARLEGANLMRAGLEGTNLVRARLEGADLRSARLEGANLSGARMDSDTDLRRANFSGSALRSIDVSNVKLSTHQVESCFGDASVSLPDHLRPAPEHWPDLNLNHRFVEHWRRWQADPAGYRPPRNPKTGRA